MYTSSSAKNKVQLVLEILLLPNTHYAVSERDMGEIFYLKQSPLYTIPALTEWEVSQENVPVDICNQPRFRSACAFIGCS